MSSACATPHDSKQMPPAVSICHELLNVLNQKYILITIYHNLILELYWYMTNPSSIKAFFAPKFTSVNRQCITHLSIENLKVKPRMSPQLVQLLAPAVSIC